MAHDFLMITNEENRILYEREFDCDSSSPLAFLLAYSCIEDNENTFYDGLSVFSHKCSQGCKIIFVTSRNIKIDLKEAEHLLNDHLLMPESTKDGRIDSERFDSKMQDLYVRMTE